MSLNAPFTPFGAFKLFLSFFFRKTCNYKKESLLLQKIQKLYEVIISYRTIAEGEVGE